MIFFAKYLNAKKKIFFLLGGEGGGGGAGLEQVIFFKRIQI